MNTFKFKTNINCGGCIKSVTPFLDKASGVKSWVVDTNNPEKILTVEAEGVTVDAVQKVIEQAGFIALPIR